MIVPVFGRKSQGKSTLSAYLARRIRKNVSGYPVLIFDPTCVYKNSAFVERTIDEDELSDAMETSGAEFIAYQPGLDALDPEFNERTVEEFSVFISTIGMGEYLRSPNLSTRALNKRPVVLVIDEASYLLRAKILDGIIRASSMDKLYLILSTHRPPDFPTLLRAQIDEIFLFHTFLPNDRNTIAEMCGEEAEETVSNLPDRHVFHYIVATRSSEVWDKPNLWYLPVRNEVQIHA